MYINQVLCTATQLFLSKVYLSGELSPTAEHTFAVSSSHRVPGGVYWSRDHRCCSRVSGTLLFRLLALAAFICSRRFGWGRNRLRCNKELFCPKRIIFLAESCLGGQLFLDSACQWGRPPRDWVWVLIPSFLLGLTRYQMQFLGLTFCFPSCLRASWSSFQALLCNQESWNSLENMGQVSLIFTEPQGWNFWKVAHREAELCDLSALNRNLSVSVFVFTLA